MIDRRRILRGVVAGFTGVLGGVMLPDVWAAPPPAKPRRQGRPTPLTDRLWLVDADTNVLALATGDGLILVDTGTPGAADQLTADLDGIAAGSVRTVFNTHFHAENTGSNERFGQSGARIVAHENTRLWMATPYWVPAESRYEDARPVSAHPTDTFYTAESVTAGGERIDYGYLIEAHTSGDIYVFFRDSNVLAVGDVASPVRDPELDYFTGAWIGGRVDAMDRLLALSDAETRIVPGYGPIMNRAALEAERDIMARVYERAVDHVRLGETVTDMLDTGIMEGLGRSWEDPARFIYDVHKGLWAHHNKLAPNVV